MNFFIHTIIILYNFPISSRTNRSIHANFLLKFSEDESFTGFFPITALDRHHKMGYDRKCFGAIALKYPKKPRQGLYIL